MNNNDYLEAGRIINTHGIRGDVKIDSWCDDVETFCCLKKIYLKESGGYKAIKIKRSVQLKEFVLAHLEGVDDFDAANALKNKTVYALREDIPIEEGAVFIKDLIGLDVIDVDTGRVYGKIKDVIIGAASDIYEIEQPGKALAYMPVVEEFVIEVDIEKGVFVRPIGGMFDEV